MQIILSQPLLSFCFFAAVLLLLVSLSVGFLRRDFKILLSRIGLIHLAFALAMAALLLGLRIALLGLPYIDPPTWFPEALQAFFSERIAALFPETQSLTASTEQLTKTWPLAGISRLPLYIFALAYGPSAGLIAGLLFAPISSIGLPAYPELLLPLELCILGWLAIVPSSFQSRWAGSFNALLAYTLTFFSAGFAYLLWRDFPLNLDSFWRYLHPSLGGVLLCSLLLFLFGPKFFKKSFKNSGIMFETIEAGLEDIVVEKQTLSDGLSTGGLTVMTGADNVKDSLDNFSPSVSTTLNLVPNKTADSEKPVNVNQQVESSAESSVAPSTKQSTKQASAQKTSKAKQRSKRGKKRKGASQAAQNNQVKAQVAKQQSAETSADTNIFLTNVDDLLRVTGVDGSTYSELLNDLPDHLSEETLWLINFLLTEAKASTINMVYKSFKASFGPNKKRFKRGVKEAHAEGWLTLMRDIEKDEVFVGLGRKLLVQSQ